MLVHKSMPAMQITCLKHDLSTKKFRCDTCDILGHKQMTMHAYILLSYFCH